jgi:hypothetical protein
VEEKGRGCRGRERKRRGEEQRTREGKRLGEEGLERDTGRDLGERHGKR